RPMWYPALAMGAGLAVTAVLAAAGVPTLGVAAIAAANGGGITLAAVLLLGGLRRRPPGRSLRGRSRPIWRSRRGRRAQPACVRAVGADAAGLGAAAAGAGAVGWLAGLVLAGLPSIVVGVAGGLVVLAAFGVLAHLAGVRSPAVSHKISYLMRRVRRAR